MTRTPACRLLSLLALLLGCGESTPAASVGTDAGGSAGEAGTTGDAGEEPEPDLPRGEYLVRHVAGCGECHTPLNEYEERDPSRFLAGMRDFEDLDPSDPERGAVHVPNLTPDALTGIGNWTDAEIRTAFLDGMAPGGLPLLPSMPYYVFHNMSAGDADQIVAYLRTIPPISNPIPPRQPLPVVFDAPVEPIPLERIPAPVLEPGDPEAAAAERGWYLATRVAACVHCHTEATPLGASMAIDLEKILLGRRPFKFGHAAGVTSGTTEGIVYSRNLTPHANGTQGWSAEDFRYALNKGYRPDLLGLCPPMPNGPLGAYGGMRRSDARDIGSYLSHLEPRDNGVIPICCSGCHVKTG